MSFGERSSATYAVLTMVTTAGMNEVLITASVSSTRSVCRCQCTASFPAWYRRRLSAGRDLCYDAVMCCPATFTAKFVLRNTQIKKRKISVSGQLNNFFYQQASLNATLLKYMHAPLYVNWPDNDLGLWHLSLKTLSAMPTHMMNICGRF